MKRQKENGKSEKGEKVKEGERGFGVGFSCIAIFDRDVGERFDFGVTAIGGSGFGLVVVKVCLVVGELSLVVWQLGLGFDELSLIVVELSLVVDELSLVVGELCLHLSKLGLVVGESSYIGGKVCLV